METQTQQIQKKKEPIVVGTGKDMRFRDDLWEKWNSDACDADKWKHGRVRNAYRDGYDQIDWSRGSK